MAAFNLYTKGNKLLHFVKVLHYIYKSTIIARMPYYYLWYSKTSLSGTPMGQAPSVPLSETDDHNWILGNIHLKFNLNFHFQSYTYKTHKGELKPL